MKANAFDAFTRGTADAVSRRRSLSTLGGAALGVTVAAPFLAEAKKDNKEDKKKCKEKCEKKSKKKCKKQVNACEEEVNLFCIGLPSEQEQDCIDALIDCCEPLKTCNAAESTECFLDNLIFVCNP